MGNAHVRHSMTGRISESQFLEPEESFRPPGTIHAALAYETSPPPIPSTLDDNDEEWLAHFPPDSPEVKVQPKTSKWKKDHVWRERRSGSREISGSQFLEPETQLGPRTRTTLASETSPPPMLSTSEDNDEEWRAHFPPDSPEVKVQLKTSKREKDHFWHERHAGSDKLSGLQLSEPEESSGPSTTHAALAFVTSPPPMFSTSEDNDEEWLAHFPPDSPEVKVQPKTLKGEKKDHFFHERHPRSGKIFGSQLFEPEKQLEPGTCATLAVETSRPMLGALGITDEEWQAHFPPDSPEVKVRAKSLRRELRNSSSEGITKTWSRSRAGRLHEDSL